MATMGTVPDGREGGVAKRMVQVVTVRNANRMMVSIEASRDGLNVSFADGLESSVPWDRIRGVEGASDVDSIELGSPYEARVKTRNGEVAEIPWDFARHFGDREYRDRMDEGRYTRATQVRPPAARLETRFRFVPTKIGGYVRRGQSHDRQA